MATSRGISLFCLIGIISSFLSPAIAQTWTSCNPMEKDNCPNAPALSSNYTTNFTDPFNTVIWNTTAGEVDVTDDGGEFTIATKLESPTIQSMFYIFFGRLEVHMKAATGQGIVSSIVLQSETLDEIDWEWIGNDEENVQTNYFGKGNTTNFDRGKHHKIDKPMEKFHNYTLYWTEEKLEWYVNEKLIRTLKYEEALGGKNYPQTPSTVRLGIWPAGDEKNDEATIKWAGGKVDYDAGPYTMVIEHMKVDDFSSGKEYEYSDKSGDWESIKIIDGTSDVTKEINKPPPKSLAQKWAEFPKGAKIGIFSAVGGVAIIAALVLAFCCVKQRRAGRKEFNVENSRFVEDQNNTMALRSKWDQKRYYGRVGPD